MAATLVVETGAGSTPPCNSYVTLAEVTAYHEEMGNLAWETAAASPDSVRITAIIRACRALDRLFVARFMGRPANYGVQSMQWPRVGAIVQLPDYTLFNNQYALYAYGYVFPSNFIPQEVKNACCEAALLELQAPGELTPNLDRGGKIESVQAGSVSVTFAPGAQALTRLVAIEGILFPVLTPKSSEVVMG